MRCVFEQFGNIVDVVSRRTYKLRGQAWVVFEREEDAEKALQSMQGFPFFNKPIVSHNADHSIDILYKFYPQVLLVPSHHLHHRFCFTFLQRISYAKTKSDAVAKLDGSYDEEQVEARKRARREAREAAQLASAPAPAPAAQEPAVEAVSATRTLFVENLPNEANEGMLLLVFQRFPGLKEVRMVPHRPGIAFVEYDNDAGAAAALGGLQGFKLATDKPMMLSYAKQ